MNGKRQRFSGELKGKVALEAFRGDGRGERLSCLSSVLPWGSVSDDGVEDGQQFPHHRGERDPLGLPGFEQTLIEAPQDWVVLACHKRCHVERGTDVGARPPQTVRLPLSVPLSRLNGATPTRAAIFLRSRVPSSGSSAMRVRAVTSPMPGTLLSRSSVSRQAGVPRMVSSRPDA